MNQLLTNFGVDWRLLIAQVVNFGILLFVLKRYAYKPILTVLKKRETIIAKGLQDAHDANETLKNVHTEASMIRSDAKTEAHAVLVSAQQEAKEIVHNAEASGEHSRNEIVLRAAKDIKNLEKESMEKLLLKSTDFIISGVTAILEKEMTPEINSRLIPRIIADARNSSRVSQ